MERRNNSNKQTKSSRNQGNNMMAKMTKTVSNFRKKRLILGNDQALPIM